MKQRINIPGLLTMLALIGALAGMAMNSSRSMAGAAGMYADDDTIVRKRFLPGEIRDTAAFFEEMRSRQRKDFAANINVLVRTYGDSVVLRWAADDYVAWRYLNRVGVNISRVDEETRMTETLVTGLKPATLERAEELFRRYGDVTTFVCRLVTVIRQLISIPAGFARMPFGRFAFFTVLGAGIWNLILLAVGAWLGRETQEMTYLELVTRGKALVADHYGWILAGLALVVAVYALCHRLAVGGRAALPATRETTE